MPPAEEQPGFYACRSDEVQPGERVIRELNGRSVGVFNVEGRFYALRNRCPHSGGALCLGPVTGTTLSARDFSFVYGMAGRILRCAWHGWEFEIESGRCLPDPRMRAKTYPVVEQDGSVYVVMSGITRLTGQPVDVSTGEHVRSAPMAEAIGRILVGMAPIAKDAVGPELRAVLWDMDGTLLDSERVWDVSLQELATKLGGILSAEARDALVGANMAVSMDIFYADLCITGRDSDADAEWLDVRTAELFADGLLWRPGARELLLGVRRAGLRTALVTATSPALVELALSSIGAEHFDAVVCGGETAAKPDAAPYRQALALLQLSAKETIVIEDSPTGVASGRAAGCRVLAVPCAVPLPQQPGVVLRPSLDGLGVDDLRLLHHDGPSD